VWLILRWQAARQWIVRVAPHASDKKYITDLEYRQTGTPNANLFLSLLVSVLQPMARGQGSRPFPLFRLQRPTLKNSLSSSRAPTIEGIMLSRALKHTRTYNTHTHTHKECPKQMRSVFDPHLLVLMRRWCA